MDIIKQLHDLCIAENISISVAESCTSGLIASKITSISGSSAYFKGGIIAYQNEIKVNVLSVSKRLIDEKTEVSSEVVEQMALNVQDKFNSDFSVANKWLCWAFRRNRKKSYWHCFYSNCNTVRSYFKQILLFRK